MALIISAPTVSEAYAQLRSFTIRVQSVASIFATQYAAGAVGLDIVEPLIGQGTQLLGLAQQVASLTALQSNFDAYVSAQTGQLQTDVHTSFLTAMSALQTLVGALIAAVPVDASGYVLDRKISASGVITTQTATAATLANVNTALTAWLATLA